MRSLLPALLTAGSLLSLAVVAHPTAAPSQTTPTGTGTAGPTDWTQWRGPARDGEINGLRPPATWPAALTRRWTVDVGLGYAMPLVVGDRIYQFSRQGDDEVMTALTAATGAVIWRTAHPAPFEMNRATAAHGAGPKSTPAYAGGRLFAIGMAGTVSAFDAASGRLLWQKPGGSTQPIFTSHAFSPLVDGPRVIFHVGGNNAGALTAFDTATGDVRWSWTGDGPAYGSPVLVTIDGVRQIVTLTQTQLVGVDADTGTLLWARPFTNSSVTNSATPVVHDRTVIVSNGGPVVALTVSRRNGQWAVEPAWENADAPYRLSNTVVTGDVLVGLSTRNSGQYFGIDVATGRTLWTSDVRQAANAAVLKAGGLWFSLEDDGELLVLRRSRTAFDVVGRYALSESATWTQPTFSGTRVFVKGVSALTLWTWE